MLSEREAKLREREDRFNETAKMNFATDSVIQDYLDGEVQKRCAEMEQVSYHSKYNFMINENNKYINNVFVCTQPWQGFTTLGKFYLVGNVWCVLHANLGSDT